jgi:hypothetical protein
MYPISYRSLLRSISQPVPPGENRADRKMRKRLFAAECSCGWRCSMLGSSEIWDEESQTNSPFICITRFRPLWHISNGAERIGANITC